MTYYAPETLTSGDPGFPAASPFTIDSPFPVVAEVTFTATGSYQLDITQVTIDGTVVDSTTITANSVTYEVPASGTVTVSISAVNYLASIKWAVPYGRTTQTVTLRADTATTATFVDRYGYVTVTNQGADLVYVRTDGQDAAVAADGSYVVPAGETRLFANGLPLWYQSSLVIPQGSNQFGGGNTASSPSSPGTVTPMGSLAGQMANPGTMVSLISSGTPTATVAAAG